MNIVVKIALVGLIGIGITACSGKGGKGPDEFGVLPTKPLEYPDDLTTLPEPDSSVRNRADQRPLADAVTALGGKAARIDSTTIPASERALLNAATRYGVAENVRAELAAQDAEFRRRNKGKVLERLFNVDIEQDRYADELLDSEAELLRMRRLGIGTPTSPKAIE
ncbi:DUF3035 domain-containing protein [Amylibacter marinus]|nr:DUF3035 domain-containing protein [Amylibacter marinus]